MAELTDTITVIGGRYAQYPESGTRVIVAILRPGGFHGLIDSNRRSFGTSREEVTKTMKPLRDGGVVQTRRGKRGLVVPDVGRLERYVDEIRNM